MKRIVFICPFFGKLPKQHMELWLQSCEGNPDIDWLIITDDETTYRYPENVKVRYTTFGDLKSYMQKKFDFELKLDSPYKLCDFKPTYGYIFSEYIQEYDFWGHCDMSDCIFGNLRKFLDENILENSDKIGFLGHMTLYRNTEEVNKRFMLPTKSGVALDEILGVSVNKAFDELTPYSINTIYEEYGFSLTRVDSMYVDISPLRFAFQASVYDDTFRQRYEKKEPLVFEWNDGCLFECKAIDGHVKKRELGYVHFQKRKMLKEFSGTPKCYYIVPNSFKHELSVGNYDVVVRLSKDRLYSVFFKLKWNAVKFRVNRLVEKVTGKGR